MLQFSLEQKWIKVIGKGVIDCAFNRKLKYIIAGDVNGDVFIVDYEGNEIRSEHFDMPVWGVDISDDLNSFAVGLADKTSGRGKFLVYSTGDTYEFTVGSPVWSVCFLVEKNKVYAASWGDGLIEFNLADKGFKVVSSEPNLFGLSALCDNRLLVTVSGKGLYDICSDTKNLNFLVPHSNVCYENSFGERFIVSGSHNGEVLFHDLDLSETSIISSGMGEVCGVAVYKQFVIFGDLVGNLLVIDRNSLTEIKFRLNLKGGIWSIEVDELNNILLVACGDGVLYCFDIIETNYSEFNIMKTHCQHSSTKPNIFINYASEDLEYAKVLYEKLRDLGYSPWMDIHSLLPGQNWEWEIQNAIKASDVFICCLSINSVNKRGYVQTELKKALKILDELPDEQIFLIPARLDNSKVPSSIESRHWVNLFEEDGMAKLLKAIKFASK